MKTAESPTSRIRPDRSTLLSMILLGIVGAAGSVPAQPSAGDTAGAASCARSTPVDYAAVGSGPHKVIVETNCAPKIDKGTIFRPVDAAGNEKYPIFVWGQGGCSQNGLSNASAMAEIASHGYFVIADGTPNGSGNVPMASGNMEAMGRQLVGYIDWAVAENDNPSSPYYRSLDTTKISTNGFSCGGLMAIGTVSDPRITTWGVTSSGMARVNDDFYALVRTPVLFIEGGPRDVAHAGGVRGYEKISRLDVPVMWFDKDIGHGGDLFQPNGGQFTKIILAWLNWWLKGDRTATGKGFLVGAECAYCSDSAWDIKSSNLP